MHEFGFLVSMKSIIKKLNVPFEKWKVVKKVNLYIKFL